MAEGTIRIIRNPIGGTISQPSSPSTENGLPKGITREPSDSASTVSATTSSASNPANGRRRHSETKRTTLSIEDRDGDQSSTVKSRQPDKRTPAPVSATDKARVYNRRKPVYMPESEAAVTATFLLSATEMVGVVAAGPVGEMTEFERGMLTPPLRRVLQRTPVGLVERATPLIDLAFLLMGGALYFNRISGGIRFPSKPQTKGVQEDTRAPQAAPVERTVDNIRAGDIDGIAVPVPSAITSHMNGSI